MTLEATHHGPYTDKPTCFVEIGSTANEWPVKEYGEVWADVLINHLHLGEPIRELKDSGNTSYEGLDGLASAYTEDSAGSDAKGVVMVLIGGGHYVPKMNDAVSYIYLFLTFYVLL